MAAQFALVTDSTADLPNALAQEKAIYIIPQVVIWGRDALRAQVDIDSPQFYRRLADESVYPTTSRPAPADVAELLRQAHEETQAETVLVLTVSKDVSGAYSATEEAIKMVNFPVEVVDTRMVSLAQGFMVLKAAELRDRAGSVAEATALVRSLIPRARMLFTPSTLEYLHRGGRIGGAQRFIGTALSIKPILHISDGKVGALESVRTRKRALARMLEIFAESVDDSRPLMAGVIHGNAPEEAAELEAQIKAHWEPETLFTSWICPSIGVHVGPGVVGLALLQ